MKILFIGSVHFSEAILKKLISLGADICGIVCKSSSDFNTDFADLGVIAQKSNIPFIYTQNINTPETENWIKDKKPDTVFCLGWSQILKPNILSIAPRGVVGYHPAELPNNKGRHPLIWALFLGLTKTASTFFFMDEGADTGDIISQEVIIINKNDTAETLYQKMTECALSQIETLYQAFVSNTIIRTPQQKGLGNTWRKRNKNDGEIDWRMCSRAIYNLVRALTRPYVGAHLAINGSEYKVWKVKIADWQNDLNNIEPGKVLNKDITSNSFDVKSYDGIIRVLEHNVPDLELIGPYI